jgi:hypothetical protein
VVAGANTIPRDVEDVIEAEVLARGHARGLIRRLAR